MKANKWKVAVLAISMFPIVPAYADCAGITGGAIKVLGVSTIATSALDASKPDPVPDVLITDNNLTVRVPTSVNLRLTSGITGLAVNSGQVLQFINDGEDVNGYCLATKATIVLPRVNVRTNRAGGTRGTTVR